MRIDLHSGPKLAHDAVIQRAALEIKESGVDLRRHTGPPDPKSGDLAFIHNYHANPDVLDRCAHRPIVILEMCDSCQFLNHDYPRHPAVKAIVKHAHLAPELMATAPIREMALRIPGAPPPKYREALSIDDAAKAVSAFTFGQYARLEPCINAAVDIEAGRESDVFFAGSTFEDHPVAGLHRMTCVKAVRSLPKIIKAEALVGRPLRGPQYLKALLSTRIVVSPWGLGELCHRDYEAMSLGAIVVKPHSDHLVTNIGMFRARETYFPCKADYSDLPAVVAEVLDLWPTLTEMRIRNRAMVVEHWQPPFIAREFAALVQRATKEAVAWA